MMRLNLLPWREQRRKEREGQLLRLTALAWVGVLLVLFYVHLQLGSLVTHQQARNGYLQQQIGLMNTQIHKIALIKKARAALLSRMHVIERLQMDRMQIVHSFNGLALAVPAGVYLTAVTEKGQAFTIAGVAQSNERISEFMRRLSGSPWFMNPVLNVINVVKAGNERLSDFKLAVQGKGMPPKKKAHPVVRR